MTGRPFYSDDAVTIWHGDALALPLPDASVDLVVTSPPYFALRSYTNDGQHYEGQLGSEATPGEYVDALIAATAEMVRVLKPAGSIWVNLGDKYAGGDPHGRNNNGSSGLLNTAVRDGRKAPVIKGASRGIGKRPDNQNVRTKSLIGIPWRYALACIDQLGLILRAEIIWSKPNGLPESVTDRVRRSHEQWFHLVRQPRYYAAVDEIREPHDDKAGPSSRFGNTGLLGGNKGGQKHAPEQGHRGAFALAEGGRVYNSLGKLPGSVWTIPTQPLTVPADLGVDHFAAFPLEWPLRIIKGWTPSGICVACGEGRRSVVDKGAPAPRVVPGRGLDYSQTVTQMGRNINGQEFNAWKAANPDRITGYACACPDTTAPTTPAVVLDPFGGTGTTGLAAKALGRRAHLVDLSLDYCRLAQWRCTDPGEYARALHVEKPPPAPAGMASLFDELDEATP